jgi:hypothetical protein
MSQKIIETLLQSGLISEEKAEQISIYEQDKKFSLHVELQTILYAGVLLFTTGTGILIYKNIDTIGHQVIIGLLAVVTAGCFYYCSKQSPPFSFGKVTHESLFYDYILLGGCLLFLTLEGYLQYQYQVFGNQYDIVAIIPAIVFFYLAYRFDHAGVLSLGITGLAAWLGITVTPLDILNSNDFSNEKIIYTGIGLSLVFGSAGFYLQSKNIKSHFTFTYANFATNIFFISILSGLFVLDWKIIYVILLFGMSYLTYWYAKRETSFYFLLLMVVYTYIGITYLAFNWMEGNDMIALAFYYFIFSCVGLILFLKNYRRFLKIHDSIQ